jgi:hypothetical protein
MWEEAQSFQALLGMLPSQNAQMWIATQKLSKPGFLWRLHHIGMMDYLLNF